MRQNPINRQKNGAISLKGFGAVKAEFVRLTNYLKYTLQKNIIYIFHTVEQKDGDTTKHRLLCEGAARDIVWQPCDIGCFLQMLGNDRLIGFTPTENYYAKGCFGIFGESKIPLLDEGTPNEYLAKLFAQMQNTISEESRSYEQEKAVYAQAVAQGRALIDEIIDAATANAFTEKFNSISYALTSYQEIRALAKVKLTELTEGGLRMNKETGLWEEKEPAVAADGDTAENTKKNKAGKKRKLKLLMKLRRQLLQAVRSKASKQNLKKVGRMRYLITPSLLNSWLYLYRAFEGYEDAAFEDFKRTLHRERSVPNEAMQAGIDFENAVVAAADGAQAKNQCVADIADIVRGGVTQVVLYQDKHIAGIDFLLYGRLDYIKAGTIFDIKYSKNYEVGKFLNSAQHPFYLEICPGAREFEYLISNGNDVFREKYRRSGAELLGRSLEDYIIEFVEFLRASGLLGLYFEKWKARE